MKCNESRVGARMSNLWFFRLKRAEQQRRRSSGEQSLGSGSLQSQTGLSSGASSDPTQHRRSDASCHSRASLFVYDDDDCDNFTCNDESNPVATSFRRRESARISQQQQDDANLREANLQQQQVSSSNEPLQSGGNSSSRRRGRLSSQTVASSSQPATGGPSAAGPSGQSASLPTNTNRQRRPLERTMRVSSVAGARLPRPNQSKKGATTYRAPVPQVTIIRSDSTSSFIPIPLGSSNDELESSCDSQTDLRRATTTTTTTCDESSLPRQDGLGQRDEAQEQPAKSQIVCQINPKTGQLETALARDDKKQQQDDATIKEQPAKAPAAVGSCDNLHEQLNSGKVPPIREKLLSPGSLGGSRASQLAAESIDNLAALIPRVRVEFHSSENTLKEQLQMYFIKDHTVSLYVRAAKLILKVLACYLYVCRVIFDRGPSYANCFGCQVKGANVTAQSNNETLSTSQQSLSKFDSLPYDGPINFRALFWVDRGAIMWTAQTTIAVICFIEALLMQYLTYKNSIFSIISFHFTLELLTNTPFIISMFLPELRTLFVPGFLNCWLAKQCLEAMLNDLSIVRQSSVFSHRLTILSATVFCLIFTSACGFQHSQRSAGAGRNHITIFESIYFVVVTFSTVGYGDFKPETWLSQLFIMVMICVALIVLPTQFEQLAYFWIERKKLGASYAHHSTRHEKHVVVCSTTLRADTIMDFLNEFYAHPLLQTFSVVLLSPCELDTTMKLVLQTPTWNNRVVYIQGSALKAGDLIRARMQSAEACFILAARNYNDRSAADEHTILRSWAIRDFSPYVPQYVQIFRTENKIHVAFAEHVVCEDEFKYALLANNCLIPGTSTLVTLLLHTSQQQQRRYHRHRRRRSAKSAASGLLNLFTRQSSRRSASHQPNKPISSSDDDDDDSQDDGSARDAEWKRLYGKCSANEIYHIRLSDSRLFGEYQGKSFTYASFHSHRKFGVALIGVQTDMRGTWPIMLNPGPSYVLKSSDILFYINVTKEENSTLMPIISQQSRPPSGKQLGDDCSAPIPPPFSPSPNSHELHAAQQQLTNQELSTASSPHPPTSIRIESSSPTIGQQHPPPPPPSQPGLDELAGRISLAPKKHSVADGASIVARSLCSVVGAEIVGVSSQEQPAKMQHPPKRASGDLQHLATSLLAKRGSSASTSAAMGVQAAAIGLGSRNASTLELAAGLRKGSNMSITSTKSRDVSPTRLKQVVSGLAVKMKRVKLGKSLTHLTIPRMDYGGSSASSTESFVNARGRRPSIAPVPAMMGESEDHDSDHEREQESYFAMSWQLPNENCPILKKFVFCTTYIGVSPTLCYLLQRKKASCCLQLISACEHCPFKNARQYNWANKCIILASDFASNGIYNFLVPLRAHFHNPNELRPIVLLLERKPTPQFIDAISWFPMVYWMPGSIDSLDDLIKAGINCAHSVVVTNKESTNSAEEDYLADCNTIVAVQTMFKMFPSAGIITELSQSSNMRFMQFRAHDLLLGGLSTMADYYSNSSVSRFKQQVPSLRCSMEKLTARAGSSAGDGLDNELIKQSAGSHHGSASHLGAAGSSNNNTSTVRDRIFMRKLQSQNRSKTLGKELNSHAYKFRLPFAAGNVFSASMLDTLLYQAFVKDYMITMVRLLLGIDQAPGSGFLSTMRITKEELWIRTYGRLYQRLCSTTCEIPIGIYRTELLESAQRNESMPFASMFASQQASYEQATEELERIEIGNMVKNRLQDLGMLVSDYDDSSSSRNNTFSYVIINPNCDIRLREGDIIYLIRPSPIHSRKLFMHRATSVRHSSDHGATTTTPAVAPTSCNQPVVQSQSVPPVKVGATNEPLMSRRKESASNHPTSPEKSGSQSGYLKSCLSEGDFDEILIKVNDQDTHSVGNEETNKDTKQRLDCPEEAEQRAARRRSSCSDVE